MMSLELLSVSWTMLRGSWEEGIGLDVMATRLHRIVTWIHPRAAAGRDHGASFMVEMDIWEVQATAVEGDKLCIGIHCKQF